MFDLTGKVALVTGGARGIGAAMARCLGEAGADVVINYTSAGSQARAQEVADYILAKGRRALTIAADVSKEEQVKEMIGKIEADFGRLDILCNNAGINSDYNIHNMELAEWQRIQDVNITGGFLCSKYALPIMKRNHYGRIIMTSSVVGEQGALFGQVHYAATKGAQISFAKTLARTVAEDGVTVNCIAPGVHMTETLEKILVNADASRMDKTVARIPLGKIGTCEDIGYATVYLASEEAGYLTGVVIDVNGGMYMR